MNQAVPFKVVAAFVRLGRKYDIDVVLDDGLRRLHQEFPATLESYDNLELDTETGWTLIKYARGIEIDVVNLAHEQNLLSVLPLAFLSLRRGHVVESGANDDGYIVTLPLVDQRTWLIYTSALPELLAKTTYAWVKAPHSDYHQSCTNPEDCDFSRSEFARRSLFPLSEPFDPIRRWQQEWGGMFCSNCAKRAKRLHSEGRSRFWDALPGAFGLPGWEELRKERVVPE